MNSNYTVFENRAHCTPISTSVPLPPISVSGIEALVFRAPVKTPVQTSFGIMHDRPACYVRITDADGVTGWGEVWCNFPQVGAEHRARLLIESVAPILLEQTWERPEQAFATLSRRMHILSVQSGEPGPLAQVIAGLDIALWDLVAKKVGLPLWQLLGGESPEVAVYASGLNPTSPEILATQRAQEGYTAFKLKVGFGEERDFMNLRAMREALGSNVQMMVDANQAWDLREAIRMAGRMSQFDLLWLEEPLAADVPLAQWSELAANCPIGLAAGENIRGDADFDAALASRALRVVQPDMAKWGGFSACVPVGQRINAGNAWFCPHWLGGGVGLAASLHMKAAVGGPGMVEIDANSNPLRSEFLLPLGQVTAGRTSLTHASGLGIEPDASSVRRYLVACNVIGKVQPFLLA